MWSWIKRIFVLALCSILLALAGLWWYAASPVALRADTVEFSIKPGSSLRSATRQMLDSGVTLNGWAFTLLGRALGRAAAIKAGSYQAERGIRVLALLDKLTAGEFTQVEITFIEGWTFKQVRAALDANPSLRHESSLLSDAEIMASLGADGRSPEGQFFPDTYLFGKGASDLDILRRAHRAMEKQLDKAWSERDADLPYQGPYDALIMASVIEKETGLDADRGLISGVFINRLRLGMMLQTDPAVIYGLGDRYSGRLRKKDLQADTPHNTYTRAGLPPTPIALPGYAALQAAVHPVKTQALYFVARGDGSSQFSRTLAEHERAVDKYQRQGRR